MQFAGQSWLKLKGQKQRGKQGMSCAPLFSQFTHSHTYSFNWIHSRWKHTLILAQRVNKFVHSRHVQSRRTSRREVCVMLKLLVAQQANRDWRHSLSPSVYSSCHSVSTVILTVIQENCCSPRRHPRRRKSKQIYWEWGNNSHRTSASWEQVDLFAEAADNGGGWWLEAGTATSLLINIMLIDASSRRKNRNSIGRSNIINWCCCASNYIDHHQPSRHIQDLDSISRH